LRHAVHRLFNRKEQLVIVPQNLFEFWSVATRKAGAAPTGLNGLGMTIDQADHWLSFFQRRFTLLPDTDELVRRWRELVKANSISGFRSHDARLVAAMQCYGIAAILTFNGKDFAALGVRVIDPSTV
jgi:predicted nucleic acid-binding protein